MYSLVNLFDLKNNVLYNTNWCGEDVARMMRAEKQTSLPVDDATTHNPARPLCIGVTGLTASRVKTTSRQ